MEEFIVPEVDAIATSVDRASLAEIKDKVKGYGASLIGDPANKPVLTQLAAVLSAVDARFAELDAVEAAAAAEAAAQAELEAQFAVDVVKDVPAASTIRIPVPAVEDAPKEKITAEYALNVANAAVRAKFGEVVTEKTIGDAIIEGWKSVKDVNPRNGRETVRLFSSAPKFNLGVEWGDDASKNMQSFKSVVVPSALASYDPSVDADALVASGGYCAPLNTDYMIPFYSEVCPTLEDFLPVVQAPRGGIKFMRPPTSSAKDAAAGIAVITCSEDKAGYDCEIPAGPTPCKPCTKIACPTTEECCVDMITWCIQFGNLNYRTFPEYVDYAMKEMAVAFNRAKQQYLLDKLDDPLNSIPVTSPTAELGLEYDLAADLLALRDRYNAEYGLCCGSTRLNIAFPCWAKSLLIQNQAALEGGLTRNGVVSDADIRSWFASLGYNVFFYEGSATGANQTLAAQGAGPVVGLPGTVVAYIFAADSFVILKNGEIDFGIVRDSSLNHANNLEIMAEEFIGFCRTGRPGFRLETTLCANGTFSAGIVPPACAPGGTVHAP